MMLLNPPEQTVATHHDLQETAQQFGPRFLAVARRYLSCESECADAVQDAMVSALQQLPRFRGMCKLETWLHRILVNVCLMKLRSQSRRRMPSLDELLPLEDGVVMTDRIDETETHSMLREALSHLPETQRSVIQLRYFEGFSTNETAELLGTNPAVVKTRLHRGCRALRESMEQRWSDAWD